MKQLMIVLVCVMVLTLGLSAVTTGDNGDIVEELKHIVDNDPGLEEALKASLRKANERIEAELDKSTLPYYIDGKVPVTLDQYYEYVEKTVKWTPQVDPKNPDNRADYNALCLFYFLVTQHKDLKHCDQKGCEKYPQFEKWLVKFAIDWGRYLDTYGSINKKIIDGFENAPDYYVEDYFEGPSGWMSFNQFFARDIRPGRRPVGSPCDDSVIVSPADSVMQGQWKIDEKLNILVEDETKLGTVVKLKKRKLKKRNSKPATGKVEYRLKVKGNTYSIKDLLDGSPYKDKFKNGTFMHSFLNTYDYHRFHTPVGGYVREVRSMIQGKVVLYVEIVNGKFDALDPAGYQFRQARGLIIIESPLVGFVAVLPIGMAQVSSVTIFAEEGRKVVKGEQFGYFAFGGSDMVILFQKGVNISAITEGKYLVGRPIAESGKVIQLNENKYLKD